MRRRVETIFGLKALLIYSCFEHPLSIFNFYTLSLFLPFYPSLSPSKLSQFCTCSQLPSFPLTFPGTRSLPVLISSLLSLICLLVFLSLLLSLIISKYFICPKTFIRKPIMPIMYTLITQGKRGQTHTQILCLN